MLFFSPSAFVQSLRFNGVGKSCLSSLFCMFRQSGKSGEIDSIRIHTRFISSVDEVSEFECDDTRDDGKAMEKETALRLAISQLASEFGKECMLSLKRFFGSRHAPVVSTGSLKLDIALGIGGLPKGRIVEIFGQEASGKTTLALHIIKEAQKLGGHCAYLDVENAMNPSLAESIGVKTEALLFSQPNSAENLLSMVDTLVKSGSLDVIVVDSVAALVPQSELDVVMDRTRPYSQSQLMTQALRKIHCSLHQSQTIIIFINQLRAKVRSGHGFGYTEEVTCGGNALKFYAAVRMRIIRKCLLKDENEITGLAVNVQVVKNKLAPAMKKAELEIRFGRVSVPVDVAEALRYLRAVFLAPLPGSAPDLPSQPVPAPPKKPPSWLRSLLKGVKQMFADEPRAGSSRPPLRIWLDLLCVNLRNPREEEEKRAHMTQAFKNAKMVVGWLGPKDDTSNLAIDIIKAWDRCMPATFGEPGDREAHPENYAPILQWMGPVAHYSEIPKGITDPRDVPSYRAISGFLNRPYFRNAWILEDMAKARFPAFLLGDDIVSWMQVLRINRVNEDIRDHGAEMFPDELRPLLEYMPLGTVYTFLKEFDARQKQDGIAPMILTNTTSSLRSSASTTGLRGTSRY